MWGNDGDVLLVGSRKDKIIKNYHGGVQSWVGWGGAQCVDAMGGQGGTSMGGQGAPRRFLRGPQRSPRGGLCQRTSGGGLDPLVRSRGVLDCAHKEVHA